MQEDSPQNLYDHPDNLFVAGFIGSPQMNFIDGKLVKEGADYVVLMNDSKIYLPEEKASKADLSAYVDKEIVVGIRPEHIKDDQRYLQEHPSHISSQVRVVEKMGSETYLYVNFGEDKIMARVDASSTAEPGDQVTLAVNENRVHLFDKDSEKTILN